MPKVVDAAEQRSRIREAARQVFARRGVAGTGLVHVAKAARISRSNLYHYYPDKAALFRDLAQELLDEEEALFRAALGEPGSALERIERLGATVAEAFSAWSEFGGVLLQVWVEEPKKVQRLLSRLREDLSSLIREGQRDGDVSSQLPPLATAAVLIGMVDGLVVQAFVDPRGGPPARDVRKTMVLAFRSILRTKESPS